MPQLCNFRALFFNVVLGSSQYLYNVVSVPLSWPDDTVGCQLSQCCLQLYQGEYPTGNLCGTIRYSTTRSRYPLDVKISLALSKSVSLRQSLQQQMFNSEVIPNYYLKSFIGKVVSPCLWSMPVT